MFLRACKLYGVDGSCTRSSFSFVFHGQTTTGVVGTAMVGASLWNLLHIYLLIRTRSAGAACQLLFVALSTTHYISCFADCQFCIF